jgi:hypothetical protein
MARTADHDATSPTARSASVVLLSSRSARRSRRLPWC